ncbi:hypothetical protein E1264_25395 [Actinomadura sp. KC216]|uniref:hypothetical protein n=1 Tax=Actinomadura sp. KC216 TaxID=2530370 RepID=UPI00104E3B6A|nr:hypothetical protein [Actinomadura sp. KC216]TDB84247.1 hypothetical protein E1264_25395 [Actinomadura sp. KC216]
MEALEVPEPWDFEQFRASVAALTGRPLRVMEIPAMPAGLCGVYVSTTGADYVYTTTGTTQFHREHIALHEIGHLLAGHRGEVGVGDLAKVLLPDLSPEVVRTVLGRTSYTSEQEREAEYFATLVLERSRPGRVEPRVAVADPAVAALLARLEDSWGRRSVNRRSGPIDQTAAVESPARDAKGEPSR